MPRPTPDPEPLAAAPGADTGGLERRAKRWARENADAIADYNRFIEACGVPLAQFRRF